jgi:hypothetical protein
MATVTGRVTYQGKPLPNAQVIFAPDDGSRVATAWTDPEGKYELGTFDQADGAILGQHRIAIVARGPEKALPPGQIGSGLPGGNVQPGDPLIPQKYLATETSELTREVVAGSNHFDFDL